MKQLVLSLIQSYGSLAAFFGLALEFLGLPIPGETMMLLLGYTSLQNNGYSLYISLVSAVAGTFAGSTFAYFIGRKYGEGVLLKFGRHTRLTKEKLDSTMEKFLKRKALLIIFSRYVPGVRHIIPYVSGISGLSFGKYLAYNLAGSVLWCISFIGLGFTLGKNWIVVERLTRAYFLIIILLAAFIFIVLKYFKKHRKAIFAVALPMLLFIKLAEDLIKKELSVFDSTIYKFVSRLISENMTSFMRFMSFLGSGTVLILVSAASIVLLWKKRKYSFYGIMIGVNLVASSFLNETFKLIFHRERPDILRLVEISGFSFPSGHSMIGLSFYGLIAYLCYRHLKSTWRYVIPVSLTVLILFIGISRIYLGVHYASDVIAGFSAGLAWLALFITVMNKMHISRVKKLASA